MRTTHTINVRTSTGPVPLVIQERGAGRPVLLLHGGAGPASVAAFADLLAQETETRVITPTHPGFGGTERPEALRTIGGLAEAYAGLLATLDLSDAVVIGNSIGGWVAAELTLLHPPRLARVALVDAVGVEVPGHPVAGALPPAELTRHAWYDPSKAPSIDPATLTPTAADVLAGNRAALELYGGTMTDPGLLPRLAGVALPTLVLWGEADRIADVAYGRALAAGIPSATFDVLEHTGHLPQMETPQLLLDALRDFVAGEKA
jgi:pimeloyl-ACP methyl ester carboxylesterase